jgi:hypothetical protein
LWVWNFLFLFCFDSFLIYLFTYLFKILKILFICIFSYWFFFSPFFWFFQYCFGVLNFNCSFCFCFVCVWEKVNPSFMCWAIAWTKTHATWKDLCHMWVGSFVEWWIMNKIDTNAHIGKSRFFQVAHSIRHSNMGCGVSSPCNDQIKEGWKSCLFNLGLVRSLMQKVLEMFGITKIGQDLHPQRNMKRRSFDLWINMNWKWFMAGKFHHIQFSLQKFVLCFKHVFPKLYHWFVCMSILGFEVPPRRPS